MRGSARRAGIAACCSTWRAPSCRMTGCSASIRTSASPAICARSSRGLEAESRDAVRVQLFDAYMTPDDYAPYSADQPLLHFRRFYGPEQRDILMLWRNRARYSLRRRAWSPSRRHARGQGRSPLPALRQVAVRRSLGGDLRLLHPPLPVRDLREEMGPSARARPSTPNPISGAHSMRGAISCLRMRFAFDLDSAPGSARIWRAQVAGLCSDLA